jgi:hypothetical protein
MKKAEWDGFHEFETYCPFIESHDFPIGVSSSDRAGIRKLYRDIDPSTPEEKDYRNSSVKMTWVKIFEAVDKFY